MNRVCYPAGGKYGDKFPFDDPRQAIAHWAEYQSKFVDPLATFLVLKGVHGEAFTGSIAKGTDDESIRKALLTSFDKWRSEPVKQWAECSVPWWAHLEEKREVILSGVARAFKVFRPEKGLFLSWLQAIRLEQFADEFLTELAREALLEACKPMVEREVKC